MSSLTHAHYERLSAMDLSFLAIEDGSAHMHIGSVSIFDAAPLRCEDGGIDFERIVSFMEAQLHKVPRLRQRLEWVPGFAQPVWVDDARFNVRFHLRHTALPPPGDVRQLKRLAGRVLSEEFDRAKPLWEDWFVDGLEGNRFALISKVHHCLADGLAGIELAGLLAGSDPDYEPPPPQDWVPRPAPGGRQLFLDELRHRVTTPVTLLRSRRGESEQNPSTAPPSLAGLRGFFEESFTGDAQSPLNVEVGPHRRFDWTRLPLDEMHEIGASAGGTVNDVALAVVTGALREFLLQRGTEVDDLNLRALVPVSVRGEADRSAMGNRVSGLLATLPLAQADPWKRLLQVVEMTHELKASGQSGAVDRFGQVVDLLPTQVLGPFFRRAARTAAANLIVTNVPGPRVPVFLLGARQLETYPVVPIAPNQALGVALLSYDGELFWGFNSDWDALPDLHDLVEFVETGFNELRAAAPSGLKMDAAEGAGV